MMEKEYLPKERAIYQAVLALFEEGGDLNSLTVSEITKRAGIGKGTAYEYFSDKEEMIAKALFYDMEIFCKHLYEGMSEKESLYTKIDFVLSTMESQISSTNCIFHMMLLSDNSILSRRIREMLEEKKLSGEIPVIGIVKGILENEFRQKETLSEEKTEYLIMSILSRILFFIMWLEKGVAKTPEERTSMRKLVCEGICREAVFMLK